MECQHPIHRLWLRSSAILLTALLLSGCFWPDEKQDQLSFTLPATFSNVPLSVGTQTYTAARGDVLLTQTFDGIVQAGTQRELYFTDGGPVTVLHVQNGDHVEPGQILIELDSAEASLDVAQAELGVQQAQLRLTQAQTGDTYSLQVAQLNLQIAQLNLQKLQWDPNAPRDQIEVAQREVALAQATVDQAQKGTTNSDSVDVPIAEVQLQLAQLAKTRAQRALAGLQLRAPISGTLRLGQDLKVGFPVEAYKEVARIVDPSSLVIESNLTAATQQFLAEGMTVQMEVKLLPGVTFPGKITVLPQPYGTGSTPVTQIIPDLKNSNLTLREGSGVTIRAEVGRHSNVLWLPKAAVQTVGGKTYVVVRQDDRLHDQEVQVGLVGDERTEIVSGLSEGAQVMGP